MGSFLGYSVIEWNEAGGPAEFPSGAWIDQTAEDVYLQKDIHEDRAAEAGRDDAYGIVSIYREED